MALAEETEALPGVSIDVVKERAEPRVVALLFFDFSNITTEGKHNLLGVFDRVSLPGGQRNLAFGFFLRVANAVEGPLEVLMYGPDNIVGSSITLAPDVEAAKALRQRHVQAIGKLDVEFKAEGNFWFGVTYQGKVIGGNRLVVEFQPEEKNDDHVGGGAAPAEGSPE
jgi:hypothetical protein